MITALTWTLPLRTVPVITVPWPLIRKQWSTEKMNGPFGSLVGLNVISLSLSMRFSIPIEPDLSDFSSPPSTLAETDTIAESLNRVFERVIRIFFSIFWMEAFLEGSGSKSTLFSTTIIFEHVISPMTRHSAVWVCIPLTMSMTRIMRSIIWAPPMMVRIKEAEISKLYYLNWIGQVYLILAPSITKFLILAFKHLTIFFWKRKIQLATL